jgi:methionyl-tRNA formyltransferase
MKKTSEKIVFFGSGPVAAASLRLLYQSFEIEAVVTKPRAVHHKGAVPVLDVADELGLTVYEAADKRSLNALFETRPVHSRVAVLIDFGIIVSQAVIDYFPLGIINSHFSLLPEWRGADPITFSILSGQDETGVSLMILVAGMDEGPLLAQAPYKLPATITTPELTDDLVLLSYKMLDEILPQYLEGSIHPFTQDPDREPTYSRKLSKEDSIVDWSKDAAQIEREIRAFIEWPKTRANFNGLEVILTQAKIFDASGVPGKTDVVDKQPVVYCGEQALLMKRLKPAGKKEMTGEAFLAGYKSQFLANP